MKVSKKTVAIGLIVALAAVGLWIFSTVWFINVLAVAIIVSGITLFVLGLRRLWRWKKMVAVGLLGILAVLGLLAFFHDAGEPKTFVAPTKPQSRLEVVPVAEFGVTQKYPPYPEVWGVWAWVGVSRARGSPAIWRMEDGKRGLSLCLHQKHANRAERPELL